MSGPFYKIDPPPLPGATVGTVLSDAVRFHGPSSKSFPESQPFVFDKPLHHPSVTNRRLLPAEEGNRCALNWAQYHQKEWETCHVDGPSTRF